MEDQDIGFSKVAKIRFCKYGRPLKGFCIDGKEIPKHRRALPIGTKGDSLLQVGASGW